MEALGMEALGKTDCRREKTKAMGSQISEHFDLQDSTSAGAAMDLGRCSGCVARRGSWLTSHERSARSTLFLSRICCWHCIDNEEVGGGSVDKEKDKVRLSSSFLVRIYVSSGEITCCRQIGQPEWVEDHSPQQNWQKPWAQGSTWSMLRSMQMQHSDSAQLISGCIGGPCCGVSPCPVPS